MSRFSAVAAMSENRVIGRNNQIPWHLPEDFKWFKKLTTGHVIVMGRKTFQSIGRPLPNRETIVLSRSHFVHPGTRTISDIRELDYSNDTRGIFICGGAEVYAQTLPLCGDLYLTLVKRTIEGNVFFPPFEDIFRFERLIIENPDFEVRHYINKSRLGTVGTEAAGELLTPPDLQP